MRSGFARLHPLVDLTFFVLVLAFAMFLSHPAVQLAGLVCAALFALRCTGRGFGRRMAMLLPLMLLAAVVNPLVSHQGVTVLFRFPSGNACTLESVLYGISAAVRLARGPRRAVGDVFRNRSAEQPGVLQHHGELAADLLARQRGAVGAVEQKRMSRLTIVVLPAPVGRTMATFWPGRTARFRSSMSGTAGS